MSQDSVLRDNYTCLSQNVIEHKMNLNMNVMNDLYFKVLV